MTKIPTPQMGFRCFDQTDNPPLREWPQIILQQIITP